jgi:hypothetical protein
MLNSGAIGWKRRHAIFSPFVAVVEVFSEQQAARRVVSATLMQGNTFLVGLQMASIGTFRTRLPADHLSPRRRKTNRRGTAFASQQIKTDRWRLHGIGSWKM